MNTEDTIPGEGEVTFDIRFYAIVPSGEHIKIILNVEAQKSYYPGYDLVARAIFYCARMISAQLDVEFTVDNYGDIKKVYSIFICMEAPKYATNTITEYSISPKQIYGNFNGHAKYDLLSALMICLDKDDYSGGSSLHKLLSTVLSESITVDEKEKILEREYDIPMSRELKEGLNIMCNLSDLVEEKGIKKGIEQEREKTRTILRNMGLSEEEIEAKIKEAQEELSKASEQN